MRENCFFVKKEDIIDNKITLSGDEFLHLSKVLRARVGDKVMCFYDQSPFFECEVAEITKHFAILSILGKKECLANPSSNIVLFQALPKLDKLELISQKLTELGVNAIQPIKTQFCIPKDNPNKQERLNKIIISACKQCNRTALLKVLPTIDIKNADFSQYDLVLFANENEDTIAIDTLHDRIKDAQNIAFIVGSEGGFSMEEIKDLSKKAHSISLGKRILRTETCAIALASYISFTKEKR